MGKGEGKRIQLGNSEKPITRKTNCVEIYSSFYRARPEDAGSLDVCVNLDNKKKREREKEKKRERKDDNDDMKE